MGHDLPRAIWPAITDEVAEIAGLGSRAAREVNRLRAAVPVGHHGAWAEDRPGGDG